MTKKQKAKIIVERMKKRYPEAQCSLMADKPHELLIATRLSAQCTDKRVNMVTGALFERYPTVDAFAAADVDEVAEYIRSCGLYKTKARDIVEMCKMLRDDYSGVVPDTIEQLTTLPGVGRKTANLIVGDVYGKPAVVCDTHLIRIAGRLGLVDTKDPKKVEDELRAILPPDESSDFCHRIVVFGREQCSAPTPKCTGCELTDVCAHYKKYGENHK